MSFDYQPEKVAKSALHFVRLKTGDVKEKRSHLSNEAIAVLLEAYGDVKPDDDPHDHWTAIHETIADCHEIIAARLATEGESVDGVGKGAVADRHLELAKRARTRARAGGGAPTFDNPGPWPIERVQSVDDRPPSE